MNAQLYDVAKNRWPITRAVLSHLKDLFR